MKISLLTDCPKHNLALMKLSTYHKKAGDQVKLNMPLWPADYRYGSYIFENGIRFGDQERGGIGARPKVRLPEDIEKLMPDYTLFNVDHSLGYTFRDCYRKCPFCKVPLLPQNLLHHSIWEFHEKRFDTIELLNNNTFFDTLWEYTFKEIYKAKLKIIEHGMDLRMLDDHKAWWIKRLMWKNEPKFAWDQMKDEKKITEGIKLLQKHKIEGTIYVLMGFNTTFEQDLYRCEIINSMGSKPFPMLYKPTKELRRFRRMIYLRYYSKYKSIKEAWKDYKRGRRK
ncbi:MAG: hypothetical protein GH144_10090 [Clostridia bacterium]|jgi:hypothetical protein|nr:hypothetical protein [Clostridia bacterium]